jgi:hypothetical protein
MGMRIATMADLSVITPIAAAAFLEEPIYAYRFPRRYQFPQDWYNYWYWLLQRSILEPGLILWLLETEIDGVKKVVSLCGWRMVDSHYPNPRKIPLEKDSWQEGLKPNTLSILSTEIFHSRNPA